MSDWHFGMDYDMWLYPPVPWHEPDWDYDLPEPIEAANIEGTLLVNAEDAIEQVRHLQAENAKLKQLVRETCRNVSEPPKDGVFWPTPHFRCSECGATHVSLEYVHYCPNCGRRVES